MTTLAQRLARPEILALEPFDIAAQANWAFGPDAIKLDANDSITMNDVTIGSLSSSNFHFA